MDNPKIYTLTQLHNSGKIYWIKSLATLRKWVLRDLKGNNYLKTIIKRDKYVPRYYFSEDNIREYIKKFQEGNV